MTRTTHTPSKTWQEARARAASLTARLGPDHPDVLAARRDFRRLYAETVLERTIRDAPPLTAEQRDRVASLLYGQGLPKVAE